MATDRFRALPEHLISSSEVYEVVVPSDTADLTYLSRELRIGGAGNLTVLRKDGTSVLFTGVVAGEHLHIRAARVMATGTTATNIVSLA